MSELSTRVQELLAALQGRSGTSPLHTDEGAFAGPVEVEPQHGHWDAAPHRSPGAAAHTGPDSSQFSGKAALLSKLAASLSAAGGLGRREPAAQLGHGQVGRVYPGSPLGVGTAAPGGSPLAAGRPVSRGAGTPAWEQLQGLLAMAAPQQPQQQHQHQYQQAQAHLPRAVQGMGGDSVARLLDTALDEQMLQPPEYQDQGSSITQEELSVLKRLLQMAPAAAARPAMQPQQAQPQPPMLPPDVIAKLKDWLAESGSPSSTLGAGAAAAGGGGAMFPPAELPRQAGPHAASAMAIAPDDPAGGSIAALLLDSVLRKRSGRDPGTPLEVPIICNGNRGTFNVETQLMTCGCTECKERAGREGVPAVTHTPTEFERHSGMAASKKWKYTVRVLTPRGTVTLGQWLEGHGIQSKYTRSSRPRPLKGMPAAGTALSPSHGGTGDGMAQHGGMSTARRGGAGSGAGTASGSDGEPDQRHTRRAPSVSGPSPIPASGFGSTFIPATAAPGRDPGASPASRPSSPEPAYWVDHRGELAAKRLQRRKTAVRAANPPSGWRAAQMSGEEEGDEGSEEALGGQPFSMPRSSQLPDPRLMEQQQQQQQGVAAGQRGAPGELPGVGARGAAGRRGGVPGGGKERALAELMGTAAAGAGSGPQLKLEDVFDGSVELGAVGQDTSGAQQQPQQPFQQHSPFAGAATPDPLRAGSGPNPPPGSSSPQGLLSQPRPGPLSRVPEPPGTTPGWSGGGPLLPRVLSVGLPRPANLPALHLGPRRAASLEHPELLSPTGKPWMVSGLAGGGQAAGGTAESQEMHVDQLRRVGSRYQATIPLVDSRGPPGQESSDPRAGAPGPPEAEALASAAGPEKLSADLMPRDAVADLWLLELDAAGRELPGGAAAAGPLERGQRQRRKPQWMRHTVDPNEVLGGRPSRAWEEEGGTPGRRGDSDAHDRSAKRPRSGSEAKRHPASYEADMAITQGRRPDITDWRVLDDGQLAMTVQLGGVTWHGVMPAPPLSARKQQAAPPPAGGKASAEGSAYESPGATDRAAGSIQQPDDTTSRLKGREVQVQPNGLEGESERNMQAERRAVADAEFQRLELQGAPEGTKCALCRLTDTDDVPEEDVGPGGRAQVGLGGLILVRVSAVSNAWVHEQCAAWSPEVAENILGSGQLDSLKDAVRRGRMIRCRVCGEKGATLGCHKATCRSSYHLHCARRQRCLLQVEPYRVACPNHVDDVPDVDPDWQAQAQEASEWEEAREKGGAATQAGDLLRRLAEVSSLQAEQDVGAIHVSRPGATPTKRQSAGAGAGRAAKGAQQQQQPAQVKEEGGTAADAYDQELLQYLGGTVGSSKWRPGRCSVCVVQRKGKCGTESAPKRCLRRQAIARNPALAKVLLPDAVSPTSDAGPRSPLSSAGLPATSPSTARLGSPPGPTAAAAAGQSLAASPLGGVGAERTEQAGASPFRQASAAAPLGASPSGGQREPPAEPAAATPPPPPAEAGLAVQGAGQRDVPGAAADQPNSTSAQNPNDGGPAHLFEGSGPEAAGPTDTDWLGRRPSQGATLRWVLSAVRPGASPEEIAELRRREALGVAPAPDGSKNHGLGGSAPTPEEQQQPTHGYVPSAQIHGAPATAMEGGHEPRDGAALAALAPTRVDAVAAGPWLGGSGATRATSEAAGTTIAAGHVAGGRQGSEPAVGVGSGVKRPRAGSGEDEGEGPEHAPQSGDRDSSEAAGSEAGRDAEVAVLCLEGGREEQVRPPETTADEGPDLSCLDHAYFKTESDRLLRRATAAQLHVVRAAYNSGRRGSAAADDASSALQQVIGALQEHKHEMEQEVPFDPEALLGELYSLESIVHSVQAGEWASSGQLHGRGPQLLSADDAVWEDADDQIDDYDFDGLNQGSRGNLSGGRRR
ncbi:hypothetical protein N2152v2_010754 [Parachlorella kessleri]